MCGLVGIWRLDGADLDVERVVAARDRLTHRGPDDCGIHVERSVALGHRRLSIIDLSPAGRMPMSNEAGDLWAVFNGEIYNFVSIRAELIAAGHTFRSHTDSEVIVHAYEEWGTESFARFDGMFALAIWDRRAQQLVLARDITGEKPLFYCAQPGRAILFGSTLDAVLVFPEVAREVDADALRMYAEFGFVPAPRSIIRGVAKVEPGTFKVFSRDGSEVTRTYWSLEHAIESSNAVRPVSLEQASTELHELLRDAVRERLVADVPLGAFLSGGVDSSLVVALMAELQPRDVRTFTIGFREQSYDESEYAHRVAKHLGVENTTMVLSADEVLRELPEVTRALDEPMADFSVLPSLAVARLARRHVTVALTGDGADEAFGGYRYYGGTRLFERMSRWVPSAVRTQLARRAGLIPDARIARAVSRAGSTDAAAYFGRSGFYRGATSGPTLRELLRVEPVRFADEIVAEFVRAHPALRPTEAGMLWDATHTLPDAWLAKVDRTTMAVALEARAPFLDRRVLEYAFRLPLDFRVRGNSKKIVLRSLLKRYLPHDLVDRPKQGFTAPMRTWFARELKDELHERLRPERIERLLAFDPTGVQKVLAAHEAGREDHTQLLWALFHLDRWYESRIEVSNATQVLES